MSDVNKIPGGSCPHCSVFFKEAGIVRRFSNNSTPEDCFSEIQNFVEQQKKL